MTEPLRVAVLACDADPRAVLSELLSRNGVDVALAGDPRELAPEQVAAIAPGVVVLSVDARLESILDRWEPLFEDPGLQVVFDEADYSAGLDGWDRSRWARHLVGKVLGRDMALPPAPEGAAEVSVPAVDLMPSPGAPLTPEQLTPPGAGLSDFIGEAGAMADAVPKLDPPGSQDASAESARADVDFSEPDSLGGDRSRVEPDPSDLDRPRGDSDDATAPAASDSFESDFESALALTGEPLAVVAPASSGGASGDGEPDLDSVSWSDDGSASVAGSDPDDDFARLLSQFDLDEREDEASLPSVDFDEGSPIALDLDDPEAALDSVAVDFDAPGPADADLAFEMDPGLDFEPSAESRSDSVADAGDDTEPAFSRGLDFDAPSGASGPASDLDAPVAPPVEASVAPPSFDFDGAGLELAPLDEPIPVAPPPTSRPPITDDDFDRLIAGLSLEPGPDLPERKAGRGIVVLLAGIGGPDALRRFLSALDSTLPVPIAIRQHLDQGNHDRLLPQIAKASRQAVLMAREGAAARGGEVSLLPDRIVLQADADQVPTFASGRESELFSGLSTLGADLVLVALSGAPAALVASALNCARSGAVLLAQNPEECFDSEVAQRFVEGGAKADTPERLARMVMEHWQ